MIDLEKDAAASERNTSLREPELVAMDSKLLQASPQKSILKPPTDFSTAESVVGAIASVAPKRSVKFHESCDSQVAKLTRVEKKGEDKDESNKKQFKLSMLSLRFSDNAT